MIKTVVVNISQKENYVEPFEITVNAGDTIEIKSQDKSQAALVIPNTKAFLELPANEGYIEHRFPTDSDLTLKVKESPIPGRYSYHVYMVVPDKFADYPGHSAPKIIIRE